MPFLNTWKWLGINFDEWLLLQSGKTDLKYMSRCHAFEKDWVTCAHGIGQTRAKKECQLEYEDFLECFNQTKTLQRIQAIRKQRDKMIKEGTYTPPPHHSGMVDDTP
ncbi:NADH dehydrogenase [ubiquinone] iron-sulfur protein 5 [Austrofundulus limnaeus]|uniref:NADH dehydrogenase [ubiquinone] iron-sulfur protein 5 n=1 Tax=Austrofundulus limnaeus TaxID=52670 RepID=A0A2I4CIW0_AUSLI|nr:PREDICTED: NADH dehydrogenase [ubiquinone] iron-sulfur protein 5 [Austrofundulus limnaeus]